MKQCVKSSSGEGKTIATIYTDNAHKEIRQII